MKNSLTLRVERDESPESPDEWSDYGRFLVAFHRDFSVEREGFSKEVCEALCLGDDDESLSEAVNEIKEKYYFFGLEAYIHSGVALALINEGSFPDRQWDVSSVGLVFISKQEATTREGARTHAKCLIETWNQYLSGDVYGYIVENESGDHLDSCWGFYGEEEAKRQGQEALEWEESKMRTAHQAKVKAQVKNRVPLQVRASV